MVHDGEKINLGSAPVAEDVRTINSMAFSSELVTPIIIVSVIIAITKKKYFYKSFRQAARMIDCALIILYGDQALHRGLNFPLSDYYLVCEKRIISVFRIKLNDQRDMLMVLFRRDKT